MEADDNDRLLAGTLPNHPAEGTVTMPKPDSKTSRPADQRPQVSLNTTTDLQRSTNQRGRAVRPRICVGHEITEAVNASIEALSRLNIYQRGGMLVDVVRTATADDEGTVRPEGSPRIRSLPRERLRECLGEAADWYCLRGQIEIPVQPPTTIAAAIEARGEWSHIRLLEGVISHPVLTPAGQILTAPGYDAGTHLIYERSVDVDVSAYPTPEEVQRAVGTLLKRIIDFEFAEDSHRSAWLAALLTPLARPAIDGPTPMMLIDANVRGAGKTLLADLLGAILFGRTLPRRTAPDDPAEWRKAILAIALAGDQVVLIDNVTSTLKSDALDAVLTGREFKDRILGRNEELTLPVRTLFIATSNNAILSADLVRRSLHIRLDAAEENPERRQDFRWPNLMGSAIRDRAVLLGAALTILRGYAAAGRPPVKMLPMGSYESWSAVVRSPLIWAGLPDPARTQDALRESADIERDEIAALLSTWHGVFGELPTTSAEAIRQAEIGSSLRDAIIGFAASPTGGLPTASGLGYAMRRIRNRTVNGLVVKASGTTKNGTAWSVRQTR